MNYKVETSDRFDRDIKKLVKKYKSLKNELAGFIHLKRTQRKVLHLGSIVTKSGLLFGAKAPANEVAHGSLLTLLRTMSKSFC